MDDYREEVERLACERTGEPFYNSSIDHAAVIVEKMFRHADHEVCIVSSHLNARVFGRDEVVEEAQAFLGNGKHRIRVVIEDGPETLSEGHGLIREFARHPGSVSIRRMPEQVRGKIDYHFAVADGDSYRFEPDKSKWEAVAAFGDPKGAENLKKVFNVIWDASAEVPLPAGA